MAKADNSEKSDNKSLEKNKSEKIEQPEVIENLPPEIKKVVEMGFSMQRFSGAMPNPLLSKLNEKHIDRILDISEKEEENSFKDSQSNKIYNLIYFILGILFFIFLTVFLVKDNKDLFLEIVKIGVAIIGGFGGGYGYKTYLDKKKNN